MNFIKEKIMVLMNQCLDEEGNIDITDELINIGMNSIRMIKLAVLLEKEFDIELEDEMPSMDNCKTVSDVINYVEQKIFD